MGGPRCGVTGAIVNCDADNRLTATGLLHRFSAATKARRAAAGSAPQARVSAIPAPAPRWTAKDRASADPRPEGWARAGRGSCHAAAQSRSEQGRVPVFRACAPRSAGRTRLAWLQASGPEVLQVYGSGPACRGRSQAPQTHPPRPAAKPHHPGSDDCSLRSAHQTGGRAPPVPRARDQAPSGP